MLKRLENWVSKQGYILIKNNKVNDSVDSQNKIVYLNTRSKIEKQIFSLLHECGHIMTRKNKKKFYKEFAVLADLEEKETLRKPLHFYVLEVEDEIRAWRYGIKLAKKLNIPLNIKKYNNYSDIYIMSYMIHSVDIRRGNLL